MSAGRPAGVVAPAGPVAVGNPAGRPAAAASRRARPPLLDALHAEWTKLRTVPSTGWLLAVSVVATVAVGVSVSSVVVCQGPARTCTADPAKLSLMGVMLGQATIAVLAVMVMTGEYSSGMIRVTLAGMPRRMTMFAAKAMVLSAVVLVAGIVAVLGSVLLSGLFLPGNGFTAADGFVPVTLTHAPILRAAVGSVLYFELIALLGLGLATAVREAGIAITVVLGLLYVVPVIGTLLHGGIWARRIERYTPMDAGLAIQATRHLATLPIGPWEGLGVVGCWAGAAMLAGWLVLRLRDA